MYNSYTCTEDIDSKYSRLDQLSILELDSWLYWKCLHEYTVSDWWRYCSVVALFVIRSRFMSCPCHLWKYYFSETAQLFDLFLVYVDLCFVDVVGVDHNFPLVCDGHHSMNVWSVNMLAMPLFWLSSIKLTSSAKSRFQKILQRREREGCRSWEFLALCFSR